MSSKMSRKLTWMLFVSCLFVLGVVLYRKNIDIMQIQKLNSQLNRGVLQSMYPDTQAAPEVTYSATESKPYLIPADNILRAMNEVQLQAVYWKYINTIQVLCRNQTRLGSFQDGGKEVCVDDLYIPKQPCLVYSFGSNNQFDFETAVTNTFKCEVHTFDPSLKTKPVVPASVTFHDYGLWDKDEKISLGWQMKSLDTIIKELGHERRTIDILKIDVDGGEWRAFPHIFNNNILQYVKQISVEIHYGEKYGSRMDKKRVSTMEQLGILRQLYEHGFAFFMHERNLWSITGSMTLVNEVSLVNVKFWNN